MEKFKQIKAHRGPIYVGMLLRNDVPYVKVVKSDLLAVLANTPDSEYEVRTKDGDMYVDNPSTTITVTVQDYR